MGHCEFQVLKEHFANLLLQLYYSFREMYRTESCVDSCGNNLNKKKENETNLIKQRMFLMQQCACRCGILLSTNIEVKYNHLKLSNRKNELTTLRHKYNFVNRLRNGKKLNKYSITIAKSSRD